ncbi:DUF2512 family protein [Clostridium magnum]|uniref:DUF2512 family protein n=1 Tax=Clostridium magnum DSM 2767 TaxID=1121326 RepID=A0A161Y672_9CLOT|nr:DUF2512 family protein [Clostridium magnum]KZL93789.1 hypothetical protein CLMAG_08400 [Clostridium magnum DSM 2767]SHI08853.1 Protein of unknown function [Clostridium magnum DSM 2767]
MTGIIMKVITYPFILIVSDYLFRDIYYSYIYQPIFIAVILAVAGNLMELSLLKLGTLLISTAADFLLAFVIIYFSQFILPGSRVTLMGAALASTLLALAEYFQHLYLIRSGKTEKSE